MIPITKQMRRGRQTTSGVVSSRLDLSNSMGAYTANKIVYKKGIPYLNFISSSPPQYYKAEKINNFQSWKHLLIDENV
jgi:hypothetical protein